MKNYLLINPTSKKNEQGATIGSLFSMLGESYGDLVGAVINRPKCKCIQSAKMGKIFTFLQENQHVKSGKSGRLIAAPTNSIEDCAKTERINSLQGATIGSLSVFLIPLPALPGL